MGRRRLAPPRRAPGTAGRVRWCFVQAKAVMQAAQRGGRPPVRATEQGHGGGHQDAANQGGVDGHGDGQRQAELFDREAMPGREAEEHDQYQERGGGDDPARPLQADRDRVVRVTAFVVGFGDPGQQERLNFKYLPRPHTPTCTAWAARFA